MIPNGFISSFVSLQAICYLFVNSYHVIFCSQLFTSQRSFIDTHTFIWMHAKILSHTLTQTELTLTSIKLRRLFRNDVVADLYGKCNIRCKLPFETLYENSITPSRAITKSTFCFRRCMTAIIHKINLISCI